MFYIVSRGSTATHWLAKNLSKHKDLVCFYSSRSFPPVTPGEGYPTNRKTWVKDNLEASKYLDSLLMCEKATHNSKLFGSIHGYHTLEIKDLVEKRGGVFKYMVRNPLELVHSAFIIYCHRYFASINKKISNEDVHDYVCEKLKNEKLKEINFTINTPKQHFLRNYLSEENFLSLKKTKNFLLNKYHLIKPQKKTYWGYEKDRGNENENVLHLFSRISRDFLSLQNSYFTNWGIEKAIKMESIFDDKNYYKNLLLELTMGRNVSNEYIDEIFSSINERVNVHREKPIQNNKIIESLPDCMKEIFLFYFKKFEIIKLCETFNYEVNMK